jgi:hypothetical protein
MKKKAKIETDATIPPQAMAPKEGPESTDEAKREAELEAQAKGHLSTLMEAEEIKSDPAKMERVKKHAGRHMKAITSIQDLKDLHDAKYGNKPSKTKQYMA